MLFQRHAVELLLIVEGSSRRAAVPVVPQSLL
jgi:hypothetical protein